MIAFLFSLSSCLPRDHSLQCSTWLPRNSVLWTHSFISNCIHMGRGVLYEKVAKPFTKQVSVSMSMYQTWEIRNRLPKTTCPVLATNGSCIKTQATFGRAQSLGLLVWVTPIGRAAPGLLICQSRAWGRAMGVFVFPSALTVELWRT